MSWGQEADIRKKFSTNIFKILFLNRESARLQVCSKMFFSTLGLSESVTGKWVKNSELYNTQIGRNNQKILRTDLKRNTTQGKRYESLVNYLNNWLSEVHKLESYYYEGLRST